MPKHTKDNPTGRSPLTDGDWDRIWRERIADPTYYDRRLCYADRHSMVPITADGRERTTSRRNFGAGGCE